MPGLYASIIGALALGLIYAYYYNGGDTLNYYHSSVCVSKLLTKDPGSFFSIMAGSFDNELHFSFDMETRYPFYWGDPHAFAVIRLTTPVIFLAFQQFIPASIIVAWITYSGMWKLFQLFNEQFPGHEKWFAFAILFFPSVIFWGSGILKDTYLLSATAWMIYAFYQMFGKKKWKIRYVIIMLICTYILFIIRPFNLFVLLAGLSVLLLHISLKNIKGSFIRIALFPVIIIVIFGASGVLFNNIAELSGGRYASLDVMMTQAYVIQDDLKKDYYGGNTFDIGAFEPTIPGMLSKFPVALMAGLFRPYLFESRTITMLVSGLENTLLLALTLYILIQLFMKLLNKGLMPVLKKSFHHPLITFSFFFSILFAFLVGLTIPNFGSLVRYKITLLPFYLSALFIMYRTIREEKKASKGYRQVSVK